MNVDPTQQLLTHWLDASAQRHKVITNNLANLDTPGFIRKDVSFDAELAMANGGDGAAIHEDRANAPRPDGNNVVLDQELAEMNTNALTQQMAVQLIQTRLQMTKIAMTGRTS